MLLRSRCGALIGMSGAGKTFLARRIAKTGVMAISCDDRIKEKLAPRLWRVAIRESTAWRRDGMPDSATYAEREAAVFSGGDSSLDEILRSSKEIPAIVDLVRLAA